MDSKGGGNGNDNYNYTASLYFRFTTWVVKVVSILEAT